MVNADSSKFHVPFGPGNEQDFLRRTIEFLKGEWDKPR
jgi:hypothetical protein